MHCLMQKFPTGWRFFRRHAVRWTLGKERERGECYRAHTHNLTVVWGWHSRLAWTRRPFPAGMKHLSKYVQVIPWNLEFVVHAGYGASPEKPALYSVCDDFSGRQQSCPRNTRTCLLRHTAGTADAIISIRIHSRHDDGRCYFHSAADAKTEWLAVRARL